MMFCYWTILDLVIICISSISQKSKSASYLDLHIEIDNRGRLKTDPSDRRDDLIFPIINFPEAQTYRVTDKNRTDLKYWGSQSRKHKLTE